MLLHFLLYLQRSTKNIYQLTEFSLDEKMWEYFLTIIKPKTNTQMLPKNKWLNLSIEKVGVMMSYVKRLLLNYFNEFISQLTLNC